MCTITYISLQTKIANLSKIQYKQKIYGTHCQTSNIRYTLVGNKIVDNSDLFGASPVGAEYILKLTPGFNG